MQTLYRPRGRALEYAFWGLELFRCDASDKGGCTHGCSYCYVPGCLKITPKQFRTGVRVREGIVPAIRAAAKRWPGTDERVLMSFFSDAYQGEGGYRHTLIRDVLWILRENQIPFTVLTKAPSRAVIDFGLFADPMRANSLGVTMTCWGSDRSAKVEPGADLPDLRYDALCEAKRRGIPTWVSLEPVLDLTETLQIINKTHKVVDQYRVGTLNHLPSKINWRDFGILVIERLEYYGCKYCIKRDLARHLAGVRYTQTDTRRTTPRVTVVNG